MKKRVMNITFSPNVSDQQANAIQKGMGKSANYLRQLSVGDSLVVGAVILSMGFVAKSFLDAFLKEAGKDAYAWIKARLVLREAEKIEPLSTEYQIRVGNVTFWDTAVEDWENRHDKILPAVHTALIAMPDSLASKAVEIELIWNSTERRYVTAVIFDTDTHVIDEDGNKLTPPVATLHYSSLTWELAVFESKLK